MQPTPRSGQGAVALRAAQLGTAPPARDTRTKPYKPTQPPTTRSLLRPAPTCPGCRHSTHSVMLQLSNSYKLATRPRRPGPTKRFRHVRSFEVGDHQAQEGRTGRQARKNVYAPHQGDFHRRP